MCHLDVSAHLEIAHIDAVSQGGKGSDVCGQLSMLAFPQQLAFPCIIDPQRCAYTGQQAALKWCKRAWNTPHWRAMHQLQAPSIFFEAVDADVSICAAICQLVSRLG